MPQWQLKHRSGELYPAKFEVLKVNEARALKNQGWEQAFDWSLYIGSQHPATPYKLLVVGNNNIQGAIAYQIKDDHIFVDLLENAPFNRYNHPNREFVNSTDLLLGEACLQSFLHKKDGFVSFIPKSKLYPYYTQRFNAKRGGLGLMYLDTVAALRLIELYYV
ncbi:hypothetical protein BK131_19025 [Paenibacillus amylolyticus]|uniref:GNAT family N-acetyltransferase n=1 Tax=Paenibacillus amylolyticus TaxID=1451 RepID=A0A1R1BQP3_PAEAM|nr:hypothetical protein [Paenibacillus amylolyticus]OMF12101.1 hypothetical protein BK131_19025 [Paenibacillus amylolyticus]